jgi:hypothetical protein
MQTALGYKMFLMFATINIGAMATFALYVTFPSHGSPYADIRVSVFSEPSPRPKAAVSKKWTSYLGLFPRRRDKLISTKGERCVQVVFPCVGYPFNINSVLALEHGEIEKYVDSDHTDSIDTKV